MIPVRARIIAAIGAVAVILTLSVLLFAVNSRLDLRTIERDQARADVRAEVLAHKHTVANYRAASAIAQVDADRNVARVTAAQATITKEITDDYEKRLAAVDARYSRVRAQIAAKTDLGSADAAPVSLTRDATCAAYGGGSCDALLAKLAVAERQAENLVGLRAWVSAQAQVEVTAEPLRRN